VREEVVKHDITHAFPVPSLFLFSSRFHFILSGSYFFKIQVDFCFYFSYDFNHFILFLLVTIYLMALRERRH
jgi:hypothetical protein